MREPNRQIVLPIGKAIEIAFKSIRLRLGRSILLMSGIALAIAFLTSVQTSDAIVRGMQQWIDSPHIDRAESVAVERLNEAMKQRGVSAGSRNVRQRWMLGLALLVAFVGIVNAMLMSVTERFREIGTMKCLGALDGFIVKLFLIESLMQGFAGSVGGVILGALAAIASAAMSYGPSILAHLPIRELLATLTLTALAGTVVTIAGAMVPARQAGRMQPVEAMRVET